MAGFAGVEVDRDGQFRILDYLSVADVGTVMNPRGLEAQLDGGANQGIGYARSQKWVYDQQYGVSLAKRFHYNKPPTILDIPQKMTWAAVDLPDPQTPIGAKGVAEAAVGAGAAALRCALAAAIGDDMVRRTPVQLDMILSSLEANGAWTTASQRTYSARAAHPSPTRNRRRRSSSTGVAPPNPSRVLSTSEMGMTETLERQLRGVFGDRLQALLTFSQSITRRRPTARCAYPGRVDRLSVGSVLLRVARAGWKRGLEMPLFSPPGSCPSTTRFLSSSSHHATRRLLVSADPFASLAVPLTYPARLRNTGQSHLLHLREGYLEASGRRRRPNSWPHRCRRSRRSVTSRLEKSASLAATGSRPHGGSNSATR